MNHKYKGFWAIITAAYESDELRLASGDWRSRIIGYRYTARYNGRISFSVGYKDDNILPTEEDAITDFQNRVDAITDSL